MDPVRTEVRTTHTPAIALGHPLDTLFDRRFAAFQQKRQKTWDMMPAAGFPLQGSNLNAFHCPPYPESCILCRERTAAASNGTYQNAAPPRRASNLVIEEVGVEELIDLVVFDRSLHRGLVDVRNLNAHR